MQWPYDITLGVHDVLTERHRQVDVEAFDSNHDDVHPHGTLTQAAEGTMGFTPEEKAKLAR